MNSPHKNIQKSVYLLLLFILLIFGLIEAREFLYPIALGILFAYLLYPVDHLLEKIGITRILAIFISLVVGLGMLAAGFYLIIMQLNVFIEDFPELKETALHNIQEINQEVSDDFGISVKQQNEWLEERVSNFFATSTELFQSAFSATSSTLVRLGLLPVYIFFLLYYRNKARHFVLMVVHERHHEKARKILNELSDVSQHYMTGVFVVVLILCVINSLGLMIVGVKYPVLLGVISAVFNFIPYFGTLIGGAVPLAVTFLTMDEGGYVVGVAVLFVIIQFVENNILTPNITGGRVKLNPYVTILSLVAGAMIWGIPGMLIIVPFTAMFKIVCDHIDWLKPVGFLLGTSGTERYALTWDKIKSFFRKKVPG